VFISLCHHRKQTEGQKKWLSNYISQELLICNSYPNHSHHTAQARSQPCILAPLCCCFCEKWQGGVVAFCLRWSPHYTTVQSFWPLQSSCQGIMLEYCWRKEQKATVHSRLNSPGIQHKTVLPEALILSAIVLLLLLFINNIYTALCNLHSHIQIPVMLHFFIYFCKLESTTPIIAIATIYQTFNLRLGPMLRVPSVLIHLASHNRRKYALFFLHFTKKDSWTISSY
jgi:hypothetical protein